jgi:hypothetical protein
MERRPSGEKNSSRVKKQKNLRLKQSANGHVRGERPRHVSETRQVACPGASAIESERDPALVVPGSLRRCVQQEQLKNKATYWWICVLLVVVDSRS